ncbi:cingulin isoform X2 [Trichomycterus rosablanca]|uniref:cingulin isoform X2 n=1 Tax=Trichomycterus rosablanca TaxID=2290929 RepID=UPI002F34FAC6
MNIISADRKPPLDCGVQIRFINDLDDKGGGYVERNRGGGAGNSSSSKYGVAVRVQGISGHPYVVLKNGEKGDSYGVQLKSQPQSPVHGLSTMFNGLPQRPKDNALTPKDPYASFGHPSSPEDETIGFGSPLRRPPGDGQAGSQGDVPGKTVERPISAPPPKHIDSKDPEGLNEAGLRPVRRTGIGTMNRANSFPEPPTLTPDKEPGVAIDTNSLAPINKLISKFDSNGTASISRRTRGRSGARARLQFDEQKRSRSLDACKEPEEETPSSPTINPYAPIVNASSVSGVGSSQPITNSSLEQSSASVAKVASVSASKPPTLIQIPKIVIDMEMPPVALNKPVTPDLLKTQSQSIDLVNGVDTQEKQAIYEILKDGSADSESSLKRKVNLLHEQFCRLKGAESNLVGNRVEPVQDQTVKSNQQLNQTKRELQDAQDQLLELRMEKEGLLSRFYQQEDQLAQLQEELRGVSESMPQSGSVHVDVITLQTELAETIMLKQKVEETLHMRERELTALKGVLKDEVAVHDRDMEALREEYSQNMQALQKSMEHVSQSQLEIEDERQKVNATILVLEEELDSYKEQSEHWSEQMTSVKQELLQAQQEKKALEEKLLSLKKQTCETDSQSLNQTDVKQAQVQLEQLKAELVKKQEELQAVKKTSQITENELKAEIDTLREQSKKDQEELAKMLEKKQQSQLHTSLSEYDSTDVLEGEIRSLKLQLEEARHAATRIGHEKDEVAQRLEEREKEREALRHGKTDLEDEKRMLDRAVEKMSKEMEMMMGDSRHSVLNLQSQLDDFKDRSRREMLDAQRLNSDRLTELQRVQNSLKAAQDEVSRLKKELQVCSEERDSAQLSKDLLSSRLKHLESGLDTEKPSQSRSREIRHLEDKVKALEIELDEEKTGAELLNDRITRSREQVDQLRSELMQERAARHDLEMDKGSLERQFKELKSRLTEMEDLPRPTSGMVILENKIQELEDQLLSEEREKNSILAAHKRTERKLKDLSATLDQERNQHAEQRDQLLLRIKALKRHVDENEGEVERLEGLRKKVLRDLEDQQELKNTLQAKVSTLENELRRKVQQTLRPTLGSTVSSEEEDAVTDSNSIASILTESQLQTTNC